MVSRSASVRSKSKVSKSAQNTSRQRKTTNDSSDNLNNDVNPRKRVLKSLSVEDAAKKPHLEETYEDGERQSGVILMLGQGDTGQLGLGESILSRKKPALVNDLCDEKFSHVIAGAMHTVCLTTNNKMYSFGCNDEFALGRATEEEEGSEYIPKPIESQLMSKKIVQVTAGDSHTTALTNTGEVYVWGTFRDSHGRIGLLKVNEVCKCPTHLDMLKERILSLSSGTDHIVMVSVTGKVYSMGCCEQGQLGRVARYYVDRHGGRRKMNVDDDDDMEGCSEQEDNTGELLVPRKVLIPKVKGNSKKPTILQVFCGAYSTWVISSNGEVFGWGLNNYNQLGFQDHEDRFRPQLVPTLTRMAVKQIAGGQHHTLLLDQNGHVYAMGRGDDGRLGLGEDLKQANDPLRISSLSNIASIAAGIGVSFAVDRNGNGFAWGFGVNLQLTTGSEDDEWTPTPLSGKNLEERKVIEISAGGQHTALLACDQDEFVPLEEST